MDTNPYAPPNQLDPAANPAIPYKLYSPQQVALATFLGAPIAGTWFLFQNYRQSGRAGAGVQALVLGLLATVALLTLSSFLPENFPNIALPLVQVFAMLYIAKALQGKEVEAHVAQGGQLGSWWAVVGIGLLCLIVIVGVFVAAAMIFSANQPDAGAMLS
ncbi:MAG: hypothetical protein JSS27_14195 [Planctomycetes bacterium]|nr:hypothetical protein [Planctomycetota bacterium]